MTICEKFKLMMASFRILGRLSLKRVVLLPEDMPIMLKISEIYILMIHMHPNINIRLKNRQLCSI